MRNQRNSGEGAVPAGAENAPRVPGSLLRHATVIVSLVVAISLLAYVSAVAAAARNSGGELISVIHQTWLVILVLTIPYLGARAYVWHQLLVQLGVGVSRRQMITAFAVGEITKYLPAGIYVENFLLARLAHFDRSAIIRSAVATTAVLGLEAALAFVMVVIVGLPHVPWLIPTLLAIVGAWFFILGTVWLSIRFWSVHLRARTPLLLRRVLILVQESLQTSQELLTFRTARLLAPAAIYILVRIVDLYIILLALGFHSVHFENVAAVYSIVVLTVILVPIPSELGIMEIIGLEAFATMGLPRSDAALVMLGQRILASGTTIVVAGAVIMAIRGEWLVEMGGERLLRRIVRHREDRSGGDDPS